MKEIKGAVLTFNWVATNIVAYIVLGQWPVLVPWIILNITFGIFLVKLCTTPDDDSASWPPGPVVGSICFPITALQAEQSTTNASPWFIPVGSIVCCVGFGLVGWSSAALGDEWRDTPATAVVGSEQTTLLQPTQQGTQCRTIVKEGPYGIVRHPLYTGLLTELVGAWIGAGASSWIGLVALIASILAYFLQLHQEEERLVARFGAEYEEYRSTGARYRLVPFLV